jgi:3-isopropylmalate/(R)-2-methylmalate dehydratase small subunit
MQNGLITIELSNDKIDLLMSNAIKIDNYKLTVNLENQQIYDQFGFESVFDFDAFRKESILKGLDDIGLTLRFEEDIKRYEINDTKIN